MDKWDDSYLHSSPRRLSGDDLHPGCNSREGRNGQVEITFIYTAARGNQEAIVYIPMKLKETEGGLIIIRIEF